MKNIQKSVRLTEKTTKYIENYRGSNFSEKLENLVYDHQERHDRLVEDWNLLNAQIQDKRSEIARLTDEIRKLRTLDQRLNPLVNALLDILSR